MLRLRTGQDFSNYKPPTLRRRVERRLNVRGVATLAGQACVLREDPEEPAALMRSSSSGHELLPGSRSLFRARTA